MPKGKPGVTMSTLACSVCAASYQVPKGTEKNKTTCSPECSRKARSIKAARVETRHCATCGGAFECRPSVPNKYCSKACMYARNKALTHRNCEVCAKPYVASPSRLTRTCSYECGYKLREVANKLPPVTMACEECGTEEQLPPSLALTYRFCSAECKESNPDTIARKRLRMAGANNPMYTGLGVHSVSATGKAYRRSSPSKELVKCAKRRAAKKQAVPGWADHEKIASVYEHARQLTLETGEVHHVDHVVPLTSDLVCGLHCEHNLQVLTAFANLSKANHVWPDMP